MIRLIQRFPILAYFMLALAISAVTVRVIFGNPTLIPAFLDWEAASGAYSTILEPAQFAMARGRPLALVINIFAAAPTLAALAVAAVLGRDALVRLAQCLRPARRGHGRRSAWIYAAMGAAIVGGSFVLLSFAPQPRQAAGLLSLLGGSAWSLAFVSVAYVLLDIGALSEELGWRGFVLGRLLGGGVPGLDSALLIGVLWAAWHLPRDLVTVLGRQGLGTFLHYELVFVPTCVLVSVVSVLACNLTGGSIWPAILVHGCGNLWGTLGGVAFGDRWPAIYLGLAFVLALACTGYFGRRLGAAAGISTPAFRAASPRSD